MRNLTLVVFLLFIVSLPGYCLQKKSVKDNQTILVKIASKELSKIFVVGDRILSVRGIDGAYQITKDEIEGSIFIKPTVFYQKKVINIFITTEQGRSFTLLLQALDIPAENIALTPLSCSRFAERFEKNTPYSELLISLMNAMKNGDLIEGYGVINIANGPTSKITPCITGRLIKVYKGSHLRGEIWCLRNNSLMTLNIEPNKFYRAGVRAISLENEILPAKGTIYLYRVLSHDR